MLISCIHSNDRSKHNELNISHNNLFYFLNVYSVDYG